MTDVFVVAEAAADFCTATTLAERVVAEKLDWADGVYRALGWTTCPKT